MFQLLCVTPYMSRVTSAGDDRAGHPPPVHGGREAEATLAGAPPVPGERLAARRTRQHAAEASVERTEGGDTGGGEETPRVHERDEEVRLGVVDGTWRECRGCQCSSSVALHSGNWKT